VAKQPAVVDYSDIQSALFSRVGGVMATAKMFDLRITQKSAGRDLIFSSINKEEHRKIEEHLKSKKVRAKNELQEEIAVAGLSDEEVDDEDEDEDEDEDMQDVQSDEDAPRRAAGDDDDSEEDACFHASYSDDGSPSSATGSEAEDDDVGMASGDEDLAKSGKKAAKAAAAAKAAKKAAKKAAGEDPEEPRKKKQKTKP